MTNLWKSKLAAYLHDPPSKCLDIATHGERSDAAFRQAGYTDVEVGAYFTHADHTGAAADRLPFPQSLAASIHCAFDGVRNTFLHPLSGDKLPFHAEFKSVAQGIEGEGAVQPALSAESLEGLSDDERWRARFFAHWRLWPKHAIEKDYRMALLPADTRIPDHSIWTHMQVVSALAGCVNENKAWQPAFLKFQLGPVQDFIAAARSIRDLWSGSYLLSWLMAAGMKALSEKVGPDAVIFPNLRGQPLFDLHWKKDLWAKVRVGGMSVWDSLGWDERDMLTPNLPNVFLAVVPADAGKDLANHVAGAIQAEWERIAGAVWHECEKVGLIADERNEDGDIIMSQTHRWQRFDSQVKRFLSLSWQVTAWPESLAEALNLADGLDDRMPIVEARKRVQAVVDTAEKQMPKDHRDGRFYLGGPNGPKEKLSNIGLGWSVILALNGWELDAVRQTRSFPPVTTGGWQIGTFNNKDALTGREAAVAGGREWVKRAAAAKSFWASLFKNDDWLGAPTLIKRVWHRAYLAPEPWNLKVDKDHFPMPNTRGVAAHEPENDCEGDETAEEAPPSEKYFAVIAFDGDEIGRWMSGEKTPPFRTQLADYKDGSGVQTQGLKVYFEKPVFDNFVCERRPLSPSYHLQFSEALSNFALLCTRPIVEAFDGRLIYAGGDDVVALLPADTAIECASVLRMAFQGSTSIKEILRSAATILRDGHLTNQQKDPKAAPPPYYQKLAAEGCLFDSEQRGFLRRLDMVDQQNRPIPFLVPGPKADCSVGLAIAHFKAPLQDVVRAAQAAEKRAKTKLGRSAVAVTLMKRSGEIVEWGCQWDTGGLAAYSKILAAMQGDVVSGKFPHRIVELVDGYQTNEPGKLGGTKPANGFDAVVSDVLEREIAVAASRQKGGNYSPDTVAAIQKAVTHYLASVEETPRKIEGLIGLCQTVAFAHRTSSDDPSLSSVSSVPSNPSAERQPT